MNMRQLWLDTILFGHPERIPLTPGGGRESTLQRWHSEGLDPDVDDIAEYAYRQAGGTLDWPRVEEVFRFDERMIPQFEEKVIERKERTQIVQDWKGNICEISNEYSTEYLRKAIDFVTRRWIKCPVESRQDWQEMKKRYNPDDPARLPDNAAELGRKLRQRSSFLQFHFSGPFWQLREWLGFEQLCLMFHDDPDFVRDMIYFWQEYVARLLERLLQYVVPDMLYLSEDMAYKTAAVPIYAIDSDGFVGELIPIWMEAGVNCTDPVEVAAGNDIVAFRREFGRDMAYRDGIDKRAIAAGGKTIEDEIERVRCVIEDGGYIPSCDHGVPADVSWPNFVYYTKLLAQRTGWL